MPELADSFRARIVPLLIHTTFGPIALVLGIVNLLPAMRRRRWALHRLLGRIYMISGLTLGLAGGYLAFFAVGGTFARLGFLFLAVGTVLTIVYSDTVVFAGATSSSIESGCCAAILSSSAP